eukprot:1139858-Pelagomonas_calceolata.AAC.9
MALRGTCVLPRKRRSRSGVPLGQADCAFPAAESVSGVPQGQADHVLPAAKSVSGYSGHFRGRLIASFLQHRVSQGISGHFRGRLTASFLRHRVSKGIQGISEAG